MALPSRGSCRRRPGHVGGPCPAGLVQKGRSRQQPAGKGSASRLFRWFACPLHSLRLAPTQPSPSGLGSCHLTSLHTVFRPRNHKFALLTCSDEHQSVHLCRAISLISTPGAAGRAETLLGSVRARSCIFQAARQLAGPSQRALRTHVPGAARGEQK